MVEGVRGAWSGLLEPVKKWFWSYHRLNTANRTWHCSTISQLPFDMHIDTNAQNCNFLSEFVSLRGSLSCQWIVRCAALSPLSLTHLSFFFFLLPLVKDLRFLIQDEAIACKTTAREEKSPNAHWLSCFNQDSSCRLRLQINMNASSKFLIAFELWDFSAGVFGNFCPAM